MALAPEITSYLAAEALSGGPDVDQAPLHVIRAGTNNRIALAGHAQKIFAIEDRYIPGPTADLHLRIYRPNGAKNLPGLVYFHGGGWVLNFLDIYDAELSDLAKASDSVIIAVNYQKAPEHPYPVPFNDCFATFLWVNENANILGIDPLKVGIGGDSAGGNLAAAVAIKTRDISGPKPAYQLLINPCNEKNFDTASYREYAEGYGLTRQRMIWFWEQYLQGSDHDQDPYACPSTAADFSNLAPAIIITAECDPLKDDGIKYEKLLRECGVQTRYLEYEGMIHGFANLGAITPKAHEAISDWAAIIKSIVD
jgi:acetyl esterase